MLACLLFQDFKGNGEWIMELALKITQMVAPVIAMIGLGCLCRKKQYIDHKGLAGLKGLSLIHI